MAFDLEAALKFLSTEHEYVSVEACGEGLFKMSVGTLDGDTVLSNPDASLADGAHDLVLETRTRAQRVVESANVVLGTMTDKPVSKRSKP